MDRTFHDVTGDMTSSDSGLFVFPFDRNGLSYLKPSLPALSRSIPVKCDDLPYCGWPYYFPLIRYSSLEYVTCFQSHANAINCMLCIIRPTVGQHFWLHHRVARP